jgi:anti-sigma factor ChrR (cupin superfamily)
MMAHLDDDTLAEHALGILPDPARIFVEGHLVACPACRANAERASETLAAAIGTMVPSGSLRARLLAAAAARGRLSRYVEPLAAFFEIDDLKARSLLDAVDEPAAWDPGPHGLGLIHVAPGPRYAQAGIDTGLVRFPAGMAWPLHRHIGEERHLFLDGGIRMRETGQAYGPGDLLVSAAGSEHAFDVLPDRDCITALLLFEGVELPPGRRLEV